MCNCNNAVLSTANILDVNQGDKKYTDNGEICYSNNNYKIVKLEGNQYPYQINNMADINSDEWFCYGAWKTYEEALDVFLEKYSN